MHKTSNFVQKFISAIAMSLTLACAGLPLSAQEWNDVGPYGTSPYDFAPEFSVPTLEGNFNIREAWTGEDSFIFLFNIAEDQFWNAVWQSDIFTLLALSPPNVHLIFLPFNQSTAQAAADASAMQTRFLAALNDAQFSQEEREHWQQRAHFVNRSLGEIGGWLVQVQQARPQGAFAIDQLQQVRELGLLAIPGANPEMGLIAIEAEFYNYEQNLAQRLAEDQSEVVAIFTNAANGGNRFAEVELPDAAAMAAYDKMEIELYLTCPDSIERNCPDWDFLANLYVCDGVNPDDCSIEIARWITPYKRQGVWVTDASNMLVHLREGGTRNFRFNTQSPWIVNLNFRFSSQGGAAPTHVIPLWRGGAYNEEYNANHEPITFRTGAMPQKVELYTLITGHGWGAEIENCAEFCNHTHHFALNGGIEHMKDHPAAGTGAGCLSRVADGVVPNQFGTWPFGRGGWCPGLDVEPYVVDLTDDVVEGLNTITYRSLFRGADYVPQPNPNAPDGGFGARIDMTSYLVFWGGDPELVVSVDEQDDAFDPTEHALGASYPNPSSAIAGIDYYIARTADVELTLIDMFGNVVATLANNALHPGHYHAKTDVSDIAPGVYYFRLKADGLVMTQKATVLR